MISLSYNMGDCPLDYQTIIALAIAAAAAIHVARALLREWRHHTTGCGACPLRALRR